MRFRGGIVENLTSSAQPTPGYWRAKEAIYFGDAAGGVQERDACRHRGTTAGLPMSVQSVSGFDVENLVRSAPQTGDAAVTRRSSYTMPGLP